MSGTYIGAVRVPCVPDGPHRVPPRAGKPLVHAVGTRGTRSFPLWAQVDVVIDAGAGARPAGGSEGEEVTGGG